MTNSACYNNVPPAASGVDGRACHSDDEAAAAARPKSLPSYCNLPLPDELSVAPPPPRLPRRQPHLRQPHSAAISPIRSQRPAPSRPRSALGGPVSVSDASAAPAAMPAATMTIQRSQFRRAAGHASSTRSSSHGRVEASSCHCSDSRSGADAHEAPGSVILLYSRHCPGAVEWAKYLHKLFTELGKHKGKLRIQHLPLEDALESVLPSQMEDEILRSRLQIVLLSPPFLDYLQTHPKAHIVGKLLHPDRVIAIMLGVKDSKIRAEHQTGLVSFPQWIHLEAKDHDLEFVQTVIYFATQILNKGVSAAAPGDEFVRAGSRRGRSRHQLNSVGSSTAPVRSSGSAHQYFHLHPKKLTQAHSRLLIVFESPQSSRSRLRIRLERRQSGLCDVEIEEWRFMNPYTVQLTVPSCCFSITHLANVLVEVDGVDRGVRSLKLESPLGELDQLLKTALDPVEFMCQSFGLSPANVEQLDALLTQRLMERIPACGLAQIKLLKEDLTDNTVVMKDDTEYPTLLHFAAYHGFFRLVSILLECPGAPVACEIRNRADLTPPEMAQLNGHTRVSQKIIDHQNNLNLPHIYDYIQQARAAAQQHRLPGGPSAANSQPQARTSDYQVPPPPRPVLDKRFHGGSSSIPSSPSPSRRPTEVRTRDVKSQTPTRSFVRKNLSKIQESPQYDEIKSPPLVQAVQKAVVEAMDDDDDVFLPNTQSTPALNSQEKSPAMQPATDTRLDYRGTLENKKHTVETELALTNELLQMLEEFRNKSYSIKEMETRFDLWRRKAAIYEIPERAKSSDFEDLKEKLKKYKPNSTLLKLFKSKTAGLAASTDDESSSNSATVSTTKETKQFRRPSVGGEIRVSSKEPSAAPAVASSNNDGNNNLSEAGNETIVESELDIINENDLSVIVVPCTPQKHNDYENTDHKHKPKQQHQPSITVQPLDIGVSSQILPLSRLSMSSSNASPPHPDSNSEGSSSSSSGSSSSTGSQVKEKLSQLRRSLTEPLLHYFHDLNLSSAECDEPDVMSTPRSLTAAASGSPTSPKSAGSAAEKKPRNLLPALKRQNVASSEETQYENMPPIIITDM